MCAPYLKLFEIRIIVNVFRVFGTFLKSHFRLLFFFLGGGGAKTLVPEGENSAKPEYQLNGSSRLPVLSYSVNTQNDTQNSCSGNLNRFTSGKKMARLPHFLQPKPKFSEDKIYETENDKKCYYVIKKNLYLHFDLKS